MTRSSPDSTVAFINRRLEDLAEANALYGKDMRLSAQDKIERNNREISWLRDLRSMLAVNALQPATPTSCPYKGPFGCKCEPGECKYRAGGDAVAGEAKALAELLRAVKSCDSYVNPESGIAAKMAAYEDALRSPDVAATPSEPVAWREETFGPGKGWYYSEQYWTGAQPLYAAPQPANAAQRPLQPAETQKIAADAIRTFCRSLGAAAVQNSHGVERIYHAGISLDALAAAVALALSSTEGK